MKKRNERPNHEIIDLVTFDPELLELEDPNQVRRIIQKIEKLMRSLSTETLDEIPTTTYINTTMGFIGDEEIQFWSNFEVEDPEDPQIVEEIYEAVKEAYEVMNA